MLRLMGPGERERILDELEAKQPELAQELRQDLLLMSDLVSLSPKMLAEFFQQTTADDWGLALRGVEQQVSQRIFDKVSTRLAEDMKVIYQGPPRPLNEVQRAQAKILAIAQQLIDAGKISLDTDQS